MQPQANNPSVPILSYASPGTVPFPVERTASGIMVWVPPDRGWRMVLPIAEMVICAGLILFFGAIATGVLFAGDGDFRPAARVAVSSALMAIAVASALRIGTIITALRFPTGVGVDEDALVAVLPAWRGRRTRRWPPSAVRRLRIRRESFAVFHSLCLGRWFVLGLRLVEHRRYHELEWIRTQLLLAAETQDTGEAQ